MTKKLTRIMIKEKKIAKKFRNVKRTANDRKND